MARIVESGIQNFENMRYEKKHIAVGIPANCIRKYRFVFEGKKY